MPFTHAESPFMSGFFRKLLGFVLLLTTIGLATCQSMLKAEPVFDQLLLSQSKQ
ncbi:MAG: hypothetical protein KJ725_09040 [Gammaproteobacteria bacterium]|uniref:hypothetical protein n=1 Tax=Methylotuvimicrobium sp. TaxID=2822413 RepID=UPI001D37C184|nr:hypothetical protein [Gammaproteobacteria bacterium]